MAYANIRGNMPLRIKNMPISGTASESDFRKKNPKSKNASYCLLKMAYAANDMPYYIK